MKLENSFFVPAPIGEAWRLLTDIPRIVACMPGAELTEVGADGAFRGRTRVKIGPVELQFNGEARLHDVDAAMHTMKVRSRASDTKGRGTVASDMGFALSAEGDRTRVDVVTDLTLSGAVAQYGRGAGLIREVANQFTRDFATNLEKMVAAEAQSAPPPPPAKPASGIGLLLRALRAMVARWLGAKQ